MDRQGNSKNYKKNATKNQQQVESSEYQNQSN